MWAPLTDAVLCFDLILSLDSGMLNVVSHNKQNQNQTKQNKPFSTKLNFGLDCLRPFCNLLNVKVGTDEVLNKYLVEELPKRLSID
jgi:hypothetical protein